MIAFRLETLKDEPIHSYWVTDFANPGTLISAPEAYYLKAEKIHSPMGLGLVAFASEADAKRIQAEDGGAFTSFENLENLVKTAEFFQIANSDETHEHGTSE
jgi:copper chaperone NosL